MSDPIEAVNLKNFLVSKGHRRETLDNLSWGTKTQRLESLMRLHGLRPQEFRHYGLGRDTEEVE